MKSILTLFSPQQIRPTSSCLEDGTNTAYSLQTGEFFTQIISQEDWRYVSFFSRQDLKKRPCFYF
jgi:hypothetical protein